jgi:hypothetical protein
VLSFEPQPQAAVVPGGCGKTVIYRGGIPDSLNGAGGRNNPLGLPYAVADPAIAAGFLFSYPLKSGPDGDKILWVVGAPRNGAVLSIDIHPIGGDRPALHFSQAADSSPGEIYPSGVSVPTPGCWSLDLRWGTHTAEADLEFD